MYIYGKFHVSCSMLIVMSQLGVLGMPDDCFYIKSKVSSRCFDAHMVLWGAPS